MAFDPFKDFEDKGYLRNIAASKDLNIVKKLEVRSFSDNLPKALEYLKNKENLFYKDILETHKILFSNIYPWAGQDRSVTAPDIAISKAGHDRMFAHPMDCQRAGGYALQLGNNLQTMQKTPGQVLGELAHSHPFLDGNGRTIMTVHSELCRRANIAIDWIKTNKEDYLKALTKELENPGKGHLDAYLKPFVLQ